MNFQNVQDVEVDRWYIQLDMHATLKKDRWDKFNVKIAFTFRETNGNVVAIAFICSKLNASECLRKCLSCAPHEMYFNIVTFLLCIFVSASFIHVEIHTGWQA